MVRHAQSTQNNKFAISLQYLKKELSNKVDFLQADKHESLLQIDRMILMGMVKHSQSSQNSKFAMPLQYLKKKVKDEVDFLHANEHQSFLQVYFNTLGIKVSYKVDIIILICASYNLKDLIKQPICFKNLESMYRPILKTTQNVFIRQVFLRQVSLTYIN